MNLIMLKNKFSVRILVVLVFELILSVPIYAEEANWPIEGDEFGNNVIYGPNDYVYNKYLEEDVPLLEYLIEGETSSKIFSVTNGTVANVKIVFNPNFFMVYGFDSYEEAFSSLTKNNIDTKFITLQVCVKVSSSEYFYYTGIALDSIQVNKGDSISIGDYIGNVGYSVKLIENPSLLLSYNVNGKFGDIYNFLHKNNEAQDIDNDQNNTVVKEIQKQEIDYRNDLISKEEGQKTFNIFRSSLIEGHPALTDYCSLEELEKVFNNVQNQINEEMTRNELFLIFNEVIQLISDNHTYISKQYLFDESMNYQIPYDLPVKLGFINKKCYVLDKYVDIIGISIGDEITEINGEKIEDVYKKLIKGAGSGDGYIKTFSEAYLLNESSFLGSGFKYLYDIYYMPENGDCFDLTIKNGDKIQWILKEEIMPTKEKSEYIPYEIKELEDDILYLSINTMSLSINDIKDIEETVDKSSAKYIILDLRKNFGGNSENIGQIFKIFYNKPFDVDRRFEVKSNGDYSFFKYTENMITGQKIFNYYSYDKEKDCYYIDQTTHEELFSTITPESKEMNKNFFVLTSEFTGSATSCLTGLFKTYSVGVILGQEGAGGFYQMCGLKFAKVPLGDFGLVLQIPLIKTYTSNEAKDIPYGRGVIPDIIIPRTIQGEISKNDLYLESAVSYIRENSIDNKDNNIDDSFSQESNASESNQKSNDNNLYRIIIVSLVLITITYLIIKRLRKSKK